MSTIDLVLEKILVDMLDIDGVEGVIVVDRDGLVIESAAKKKLDKEAIAGVLHEFAEAINLLGAQFNAGELKTAIIEYANARAFINPIVEGYYLVVIGTHDLNLGRMKLELRKVMPKLQEVFA